MPDPAWVEDGERPDEGGNDEERDAPPDPRLWFLRDPAAMARRLVLAEILGEPRSSTSSPAHAPPTTRKRR